MLTDRHDKILRLLIDPVMCPEGYRIQKGDQNAIREALAEIERLRVACAQENHEIEQILGRALGYPKFADDQMSFPGATDADGVCVGDHVAVTLADEAARRIENLQVEIEKSNDVIRRLWNECD